MSDLDRRGEQMGAFHFLVGLAALPASTLAGTLYDLSPSAPFWIGAGCALVAAAILLTQRQ